MKICLIANPTWSHVKRWITAIADNGHQVHVICDESYKDQVINTASVTYHPLALSSIKWRLPWLIKYMIKIRKAVNAIKPDLIHCHNCELTALPCILYRWRPLIVSVYGMDVTRYGGDRDKSALLYVVKKWILRKCERITATSEFLAGMTVKYASVKREKISLIPFGVDSDFYHQMNPVPAHRIKIVVLKDLREEYGFNHFIDAVQMIKSQVPDVKVLIGGDGSGRASLEDYVHQMNLSDTVTFFGALPQNKVRQFLSQASIVVMPSLHESFGVVALEAQSLEIPVVGVDVGGLREVLQDQRTGILVPPKNPEAMSAAILGLINRPERRKQMGSAGRAYVQQKFEWDDNVRAMCALYNRYCTKEF